MKALLVAILLISSSAKAVDFELSLGQTTYDKSENGQWYQEGLDYKFHLQTNSIGLSVTDYLTDDIRWRVGYINLGEMSSNALATYDNNYNGSNGCVGNCVAMDVYIGKGNVEGIYLTIAPEMKIGKTKIFVEPGVWGYIPHFNLVRYDTSTGGASTYKGDDLTTDTHMQFGLVLGFGIEYDNLQLVVASYGTQVSNVVGNTVPNWGDRTTNISLRKRF